MRLDMHCHVKEGSPDSHVGIEEFIGILKEKGFDGMVVTDHDSYNGWRYYDENLRDKIDDFVVIKGIEYDTLEAGHILVIMPTGTDMKIFEHKGLPVRTLIKIVHAYGGILGPAHPCGEPFLSIFSTGLYKFDRSIMKKFDFIECANSGENPEANDKAKAIAGEYNKPMTGGADSHWTDCCGLSYTILDEDIRTEDDLIAYIKAGKHTEVGGEQYMGTIKERIGRFNKILVVGFFPYNKVGALKHRRKRKSELANISWDLRKLNEQNIERFEALKEHIEHEHKGKILEHLAELMEDEKVKAMNRFRQHGQISTLEHSERVTIAADKLSKKLRLKNLDRKSMLRGALLHDFYLYDWHHEDDGEHKWHGFHHADKARENATKHFDLNEKEQSIINTHMWPLNITKIPRSREAWVVCMADKYVSFKETLFDRKIK